MCSGISGSFGGSDVAGLRVGISGTGWLVRKGRGDPPYCPDLRVDAGVWGNALLSRGVWSITEGAVFESSS